MNIKGSEGAGFDAGGYDMLTGSQRLAVAAHELAHIKHRDPRHQQRHVTIPGYLAWVASFLLYFELILRALSPGLPARAWSIVAILAFVASSFTWLGCLVVLLLVNGGWRRAAEFRCDLAAASFISGEDMIAALRVQENLLSSELKKSVRHRVNSRLFHYPSFQEREEAIRRGIPRLLPPAWTSSLEVLGRFPLRLSSFLELLSIVT